MLRRESTGLTSRVGFVLGVVLILGLMGWLQQAFACPPPEGAAKKLAPFKVRPPGLLRLSLPEGVTEMPGFPRVSSTWCCGAALYCQIDDADVTHEVLMPCTAECFAFACPQIHRCYDSIWVMKSGGVNARGFPATMTGHPCSCMAAADIDGDNKPEIVIGSDINPPESAKKPDSRIYAFNHDGTAVSGFPKDVECGPIPGGMCLVDLDSWGEGGDSAPEILFGTRGWVQQSTPNPGKITALNADGSYITSWNKLPDDYQVVNSPAVGNLLDGENFPGNEVVFVVNRFYQTIEGYRYESRVIVFKRDGTQLDTYDLGDVRTGPVGTMSSPAIGKILTYENSSIKSNIVVCSGANMTAINPTPGKIWILHLVPNGNSATIALDWSHEATEQDCDYPDEFRADPLVADLDNDGQNEVVAHSGEGTLYVVDRVDGEFVVATALTIECGSCGSRHASPLVWDLDASHSTLEIVVCNRAGLDPDEAYLFVYQYNGLDQQLTRLYQDGIGPFEAAIEMTPALGDLDADDKADIVFQPLWGGLIYCLEFDNSDYDAAINSKGWPCMGRNAQRTHCAD